MRALSASEAVAPAFKRTKEILFQRFHWRRSWKMAGVGMVSGLAILYLPNIPTLNQPVMPPGTNLGNAFLVSMRVFSIVMALGMSAFMLALFYLGARMQLVLFETTVTGQSIIAPIWKRYGRRTWRWIGIRILPSIVLVIPFVFMMLGLTRAIAHQQAEIQAGMAPASPFHLFRVVLGVVIGFWLIGGFAMFIGGLIADFTLPFIALEDTSYSLAWKRLAETIQNDPPGVALYALIKLCLGIALMIAGYLLLYRHRGSGVIAGPVRIPAQAAAGACRHLRFDHDVPVDHAGHSCAAGVFHLHLCPARRRGLYFSSGLYDLLSRRALSAVGRSTGATTTGIRAAAAGAFSVAATLCPCARPA